MKRFIPAVALTILALSISGAALSDSTLNNSGDMSSNDSFKKMDTNQDGTLNPTEANTNGKMGDQFAVMDANKDGKISLTEYQNYITTTHGDSNDLAK